jgi:hypothetical protein
VIERASTKLELRWQRLTIADSSLVPLTFRFSLITSLPILSLSEDTGVNCPSAIVVLSRCFRLNYQGSTACLGPGVV